MNEDMKVAWLEISEMLGEPTNEDFDVFMRTWQRASQATRKALAEQPAQRTWVGLTNNELQPIADEYRILFGSWVEDFARAIEAAHGIKEKT